MTGISSTSNNIILDTPHERYLKYKKTSETYQIIQLGLTTWQEDISLTPITTSKTKRTLASQTYSIYLFPIDNHDNAILSCELPSILFNRKHGNIDWNKWIYKGVPYMNDKQYKQNYKDIIDDNVNLISYNTNCFFQLSAEEKKQCDEIIQEINETFIKDTTSMNNDYIIKKIPQKQLLYIIHHLSLLNNVDDIRNEIYFSYCSFSNNKRMILLTKIRDKEHKAQLLKEETMKRLDRLHMRKGVKLIYDELINSNKIIIGHNISLDILFMISHLGEELPSDYNEFKERMHKYFECVYDTKVLYEYLQNEGSTFINPIISLAFRDINSVLDKMFPVLLRLEGENVIIKELQNESKSNILKGNNFHNAGYDSFITGVVFFQLEYIYKSNDNLTKTFNELNNKIHIMKSMYKWFDLNNEGKFIIENGMAFIFKPNKKYKVSDIDIRLIYNDIQLYNDHVGKVWTCDSYNIMVIMLKNGTEDKKQLLLTKCDEYNKKEMVFKVYTLEEYRNKRRK